MKKESTNGGIASTNRVMLFHTLIILILSFLGKFAAWKATKDTWLTHWG